MAEYEDDLKAAVDGSPEGEMPPPEAMPPAEPEAPAASKTVTIPKNMLPPGVKDGDTVTLRVSAVGEDECECEMADEPTSEQGNGASWEDDLRNSMSARTEGTQE